VKKLQYDILNNIQKIWLPFAMPDDESVQGSAKDHCVFVYFLINCVSQANTSKTD